MGISLVNLFEVALFILNAMAILNEKRFLKKRGWHRPEYSTGENEGVPFVKSQIITLLQASRSFGKYILIPLNILTIFFELLLG